LERNPWKKEQKLIDKNDQIHTSDGKLEAPIWLN